jgi:hypothetical protein
MLNALPAALHQEAAMSQFNVLPVPSETRLWVSWVLALISVVALAVTFVAGVAVLATAI